MTENKHNICPICGKQADPKYHPFCSKKCADIDLGRWLKGSYVVHTNEVPDEEDLLAEQSQETTNI